MRFAGCTGGKDEPPMDYTVLDAFAGINLKIPLLSATLTIYDISYFTNTRSTDFAHNHFFHEIYLMLDGQASVVVDAERLPLSSGELLYLAPGVTHHFDYLPGTEFRYCNFAFDIDYKPAELNLPESIKDERFLIQNMRAHPWLRAQDGFGCRAAVDSLCYSQQTHYMGDFIKIRNYMANFFISALQAYSPIKSRPDFIEAITPENERIKNQTLKIAHYIQTHYTDDLSIENVSRALSYSPRHIQRMVSGYFGMSFSNLVLCYRIGHAQHLLYLTDLTIEQISERCGFSSSKIFTRHFKEQHGMTPTEYRHQTRRRNGRDS